jgi:hypothetical protein
VRFAGFGVADLIWNFANKNCKKIIAQLSLQAQRASFVFPSNYSLDVSSLIANE